MQFTVCVETLKTFSQNILYDLFMTVNPCCVFFMGINHVKANASYRSSRSQLFFRIGIIENLSNFPGKNLR